MGTILPQDGQEEDEMARSLTRTIAEQLPGGFFIYRADGEQELLFSNRATWEIFGCADLTEFRALTGHTFPGMVHPKDREAVSVSIAAQIAAGGRRLDRVEYRIVRRDGALRWVDDFGRLVHTDDLGDVYYVFISDATDKHLAREEDRRKAEVIEGLSTDFNSIYLLDLVSGAMRPYRLRAPYFQEVAEELGIPADARRADLRSVLPAYADRFVVPEDQEAFLREISSAHVRERLRTERSYTVEYRSSYAEGEISYMEMSIVGIGDETRPSHAVLGFRDVTGPTLRIQKDTSDKLHMEMELEKERHVNEVKSSFLFNISHDIRTPMNAIMGFTDLAKRHIGDPEALAGHLEKVEEASRHMLSLIDSLLELSEADSGRVHIEAGPCRLDEQVEMVLDMYRPQIARKRIVLETDIDLPPDPVLADAPRFRRALDNLLGNAVKFTPDGGAVTVSARQSRASRSGYARYEFRISDTGIGMSKEFMARMYEAFEREETSTRSGYIGTGVGLSITKHLLDIMGGSIQVESEKGKGSTFTIYLPLRLAERTEAAVPQAAEAPEDSSSGGAGRRILLVEDIEINRMLAETLLSESGFLVESVEDGCDAVEAVRDRPPGYYDLVLMDIQMPVMNGYEATRAIRALGREDTDGLPIVALSANAGERDRKMSLESGMDAHVAKPFDIARLISVIDLYTTAKSRPDGQGTRGEDV